MEGNTNLAVHISGFATAQNLSVALALFQKGDNAILLQFVSLRALEDGLVHRVTDGTARHQFHERLYKLIGNGLVYKDSAISLAVLPAVVVDGHLNARVGGQHMKMIEH